jgi:hypothetical protein
MTPYDTVAVPPTSSPTSMHPELPQDVLLLRPQHPWPGTVSDITSSSSDNSITNDGESFSGAFMADRCGLWYQPGVFGRVSLGVGAGEGNGTDPAAASATCLWQGESMSKFCKAVGRDQDVLLLLSIKSLSYGIWSH